MGNFNPNYFDRKAGSLERAVLDAVNGVKTQIEEKKSVKETNKNDKSDDGEGMDAVQPKAVKKKFDDRKDKDIDNDGDVDSSDKFLHKKRKAISKAINKENFIGTPENTNAKLDATPGQSSDEWNQQVELMQKKNTSMREALAKVWGFDEGKNPFEKNIDEKKEMGFKVEFGKGDDAGMAVYRDKKDAEAFAKRQPKPIKITKGMYDRFDEEDKTMTGKPATKVSVDPDMKEKKN